LVGLIALYVACVQLTAANASLRAANTIALSRSEREVADRVLAAGGDEAKLNGAYNLYGDYLAYASYLDSQGQIDKAIWEKIRVDFCADLNDLPGLNLWYTRNKTTERILDFFPQFGELRQKCADQPKDASG
jgi:hypothetical protein